MEFVESAVIVDVDGTLTLNGGRDPFDWDRVLGDLPNRPVIEVVLALKSAGKRLLFMSGRPYTCGNDTLKWIRTHVDAEILISDLFMRTVGDDRPDEVIKRELYDIFIDGNYQVDCVLDDRDCVVKMWRSLGLTCLQVAEAPFLWSSLDRPP